MPIIKNSNVWARITSVFARDDGQFDVHYETSGWLKAREEQSGSRATPLICKMTVNAKDELEALGIAIDCFTKAGIEIKSG